MTKPKLDVLEQLERWYTNMAILRDSDYPQLIILANAIAEIKRLGKLVDGLHCTNAMLRAITEAEPETIARRFHETYERLAPEFGYETRRASAVAWEDVPENNRALMIATVRALAVVAPKGDTEE